MNEKQERYELKRLKELLEKEIITEDELEEIKEMEIVKEVKNCGESGRHFNHWYFNIILKNNDEYDIYTKEENIEEQINDNDEEDEDLEP